MQENNTTRQDGKNAQMMMPLYGTTQKEVGRKLKYDEPKMSKLLKQTIIEDAELDKIAQAIHPELTADCIKDFNLDAIQRTVINNNYIDVQAGGKNAITDYSTNEIINNELALIEKFEKSLNENATLKEKLIYFRMQVEPEKVKAEMEKES